MKKLALLLASLAVALLAGGCASKGSSADAPQDFRVVAGDASAIVTWTAAPDVEYWLFYGPGSGITTTNWTTTTGGTAIPKVSSPHVVTGLVNGTTYSFTINARKNGGPGGSGAPTQVVVPMLAGANWTVGAPLGAGGLNGIAVGNVLTGSAHVAVGTGGAIFTSINGAATTTPTNPAAPADLNAVWYSTLGFVAVGANGTIVYSADATTWTTQTSGTTANLYGLTSIGTGGFVAVGAAGTIVNSASGTSWILAGTPVTPNDLYAATFGNNKYVAVGANGTILTSTDTVTWTAATSGTSRDLRGVAFAALPSETPITSSTIYTYVFVAVGPAGTVLTSNDGATWTTRPPISTNDLTAVVYGGQFVAVSKGGGIFTSPDGITWQARTSGTTNDLAAVARTLSGYTAVGAAGTNVSSF